VLLDIMTRVRDLGGQGSDDPQEIYVGVKHGTLTTNILGRKYFPVHRSVDFQPNHRNCCHQLSIKF